MKEIPCMKVICVYKKKLERNVMGCIVLNLFNSTQLQMKIQQDSTRRTRKFLKRDFHSFCNKRVLLSGMYL